MPSTISDFNLGRQAIVLFGSVSLFVVYKLQLFKLDDYNNLALAFSIVMFLWLISIFVRYMFYTDDMSGKMDNIPKIGIPGNLKCCIKMNKCEDGDLNIWSLIHFIMYAIIGYFIPGYYLAILYISIVCELFELGMGYTSKLILDPVTNLAGYFVGSLLSPRS